MNILTGLVFFILGTFLLFRGADWFMDGVQDLAPLLGMSALVLGILLASLEPEEMLTAAIASFRGTSTLAVGNVIGTNIVITTLALGLSALIYPLIVDHVIRRQAMIATLVSIIPIILLITELIGRFEGLLMLLLFGGYTLLLFRQNPIITSSHQTLADQDSPKHETVPLPSQKQRAYVLPMLGITVGGLIALTVGGFILVEGALRLAVGFNVSEGIVGATIISLGTGAEMIALGISAARRRQAQVLVGGVIGSFAFNLLVTLGVAAIIRPLPIDLQLIRVALPVMIGVHLLLLAFVWRGKITRSMGGLLVTIYLVYLIIVVIPTP